MIPLLTYCEARGLSYGDAHARAQIGAIRIVPIRTALGIRRFVVEAPPPAVKAERPERPTEAVMGALERLGSGTTTQLSRESGVQTRTVAVVMSRSLASRLVATRPHDGPTMWVWVDPPAEPEADPATVAMRLARSVDGCTAAEVAARSGVTVKVARSCIRELVRDGKIARQGASRPALYRISEKK